jgi:zinc transport system ATP-binding protein
LLDLIPPVSGRVVVTPGVKVAYVPQAAAIDAALPVRARDVVRWGRLSGASFLVPFTSRADRAACERALEEAGAADLAARPYRDLSEGQKQRVLFARVLASEADLVLLDEPTAALDATAERDAMARLAGLARNGRRAVLAVTHALGPAGAHAEQVIFLDREAGVMAGSPGAVYASPVFQRQLGEVEQ